jgi:hypothetical protein
LKWRHVHHYAFDRFIKMIKMEFMFFAVRVQCVRHI